MELCRQITWCGPRLVWSTNEHRIKSPRTVILLLSQTIAHVSVSSTAMFHKVRSISLLSRMSCFTYSRVHKRLTNLSHIFFKLLKPTLWRSCWVLVTVFLSERISPQKSRGTSVIIINQNALFLLLWSFVCLLHYFFSAEKIKRPKFCIFLWNPLTCSNTAWNTIFRVIHLVLTLLKKSIFVFNFSIYKNSDLIFYTDIVADG